ncbi:MAG: hypothetical protein E7437_04140 [Ruminococcaceae bacterium]|nr:hypothetical protein [Oscillospiraceae bacterium]
MSDRLFTICTILYRCLHIDLVHSHAVKNTAEGINMFDGTTWQFFHDGEKGEHPAWASPSPNKPRNALGHILNAIA